MARTPLRLVGHFTISVVCQLYWDYTLPFVVGNEQHLATSQSAPSRQPAHPNATTPQQPQQPQQQIITTNCVLAYACFSTLVLWQVLLWSSVAFLRYLDECHRTGVCVKWLGVNGKLKAPDKHVEPDHDQKLHVAKRNMASLVLTLSIVYTLIARTFPGHFSYSPQSASSKFFVVRWLWTILGFIFHLAVSDLLFYSGHYAMHRWKWMKRHHALHHSTWASDAIGGYYMSPLDFYLEHGPAFVSWAVFGWIDASWMTIICVGAYNLLFVHSAWDMKWGPDPREHFLHHNGDRETVKKGLGIFLDKVFGTGITVPTGMVFEEPPVPKSRTTLKAE